MTSPPRLTAELTLRTPLGVYAASWSEASARSRPGISTAIRPMASDACVSRCVGPSTASYCDAKCTGDTACWQSCVGAEAYPCVQSCFTTS